MEAQRKNAEELGAEFSKHYCKQLYCKIKKIPTEIRITEILVADFLYETPSKRTHDIP